MKKVSVIFSDIEIGTGNNTDDFVEDELLANTIKHNLKYAKKYPLDLVFNGDIFDFLKAPYKKTFPRHVTEEISLWKLRAMHDAHPLFFSTLSKCLKYKNVRIIFIHGNHDYDLVFPKVQEELKKLIKGDKILFPGFEYTDNLVHYEHGSQLDDLFYINPKKIISNPQDKQPFLLLPWYFNAMTEHYFPLKEEYPVIERLQPRAKVLEILPLRLKKKIIFDIVFYMIKSLLYTQFKHWDDILYRFSYTEFKKYFKKLVHKEFELQFENRAKEVLLKNEYSVIVYGHNHKEDLIRIKNKSILNTGNWRDEYELNPEKASYLPKDKSYGFIMFDEEKIYDIKLIKVKTNQKEKTIKEILSSLEAKQ
jgi:UDP-2,3-diacylglucosamine pyrophosphatase LpxH